MEIKIKGFGSARQLTGIKITLHENISVSQLRQQLITIVSQENNDEIITIINSCVFANTHAVLTEDDMITHDQVLNILPPVCGG